jgi:hypothetical protein
LKFLFMLGSACCRLDAGSFLSLFFDIKDGRDKLLRNVGRLSTLYAALYLGYKALYRVHAIV